MFEDCLKREILEETGIEIENNEIKCLFMKIVHMNRDWPSIGKNRKSEIYYYLIETNKFPNLSMTSYTEHEKKGNFKVRLVPLNDSVEIIKNNICKNEKNKVIAPDMIIVISEYLKLC